MKNEQCKRCGAPLTAEAPTDAGNSLQGMCTKCLLELGLDEDSHVVITGAAEAPAPPPSPEELQPLFPNHHIEAVLGQGGMGVVYRATQKGLDRVVALKVLPAKAGRDPAFAERFTREAKALASLNHPNITSVFDFGKAGEHHYLAMEFVDGVNLRQLLATSKVGPKQALQIVEQICDALQYAHDEGVVHRDIKPENILIDRKGRLKITDFGLAKLLGVEDTAPTGLTMTHQVMGTPHYMAPEQVEHPTDVDHRADIYSLGVVFYELLTGELPIGRFTPPSGKVQVDVKLDEVVLRALEKEPAMRYQTAGAVKTDVHGIHEPGTGAPESRPSRAAARATQAGATNGGGGRPRRWWPWILAGCVGAIALFVLAAGLIATFVGQRADGARQAAMFQAERARADQQAQEMEAIIDKLVGVELFEVTDGLPGASVAMRNAFGISAETAEGITRTLNGGEQRYHALLAQNTQYEFVDHTTVRIEVAAFAEPLEALIEDVERELASMLPDEARHLLELRDVVRTELYPQGGEDVVISLTGVDGGFTYVANPELPAAASEYWHRMFGRLIRPLAPSVVPGIDVFLAEISAMSAGGAEVTANRVEFGYSQRPDLPISVEADLLVVAENSIEGHRLLHQMVERLSAAGAIVDLGSTDVPKDGQGVRAGRIKVWLAGANPGITAIEDGASGVDLSLALRRISSEEEVGDIRIMTRRLYDGAFFRDMQYDVSFEESTMDLDAFLAWADRIEGLGADSVISELTLQFGPAAARRGESERKPGQVSASNIEVLARHLP